ncbi:MAG: DNA polymerase I [Alphaproteobacteria bacterium]
MTENTSQLILVDGSGYIFRAYYALPPMHTSKGIPVNAVFGFTNMLLKFVEDIQREQGGGVRIAVIFDAARKTFRNDIYPDYKANRSDPPEDLIPQFELIKKVPLVFNIPSIQLEGYEADDLIASYAHAASKLGQKTSIVSSDKDLMQLIDEKVSMIDPLKKKQITEKNVLEKFGVKPEKVIEVQALAGDSSDNIPGVPGIGPKTAAQLINQYSTVENLIDNVENITQKKRKETIILNKDLALISKKLVTLKNDIKLPLEIKELDFKPLEVGKLLDFLDELEFSRIKANVISKYGNQENSNKNLTNNLSVKKESQEEEDAKYYIPNNPIIDRGKYETVTKIDQLKRWVQKIYDHGVIAIDCETTSLNAVEANIVGLSISIGNGDACYIPLAHDIEEQISIDEFIMEIRKPLEDKSILKVGQNIKYDLLILEGIGINVVNLDDTMLMSYVLRTGKRGHGLDELSLDFLSHETIKYNQITTIDKKKIPFNEVDIKQATQYAAEDSDVTFRLWEKLRIELIRNNLFEFYFFIEKPLIHVIASMEKNGFKINDYELEKLSTQFSGKLKNFEKKIYDISEEEFNVGSPKQLGEVLFEKLNLPHGKKGKSGNYQTDVKVLEKLKNEKVEIASLILDWRQFSKLKNTYCEGLISRKNKITNRIHTSFGMASTLTGRLSSNDPNLQNIPIKNIEGRQIRKAFIAEAGNKILSFDYSQIELRILAHVANIEVLLDAFSNDEDIHSITATDVFHLTKDKVTDELRRKAKIINFGIIYGISPYGLALQLEISNTEAKNYMDQYFLKYPGIKNYMEKTINQCRSDGFILTPFGRRIFIPLINDSMMTRRNFAERSAINAPIQGGAADLIKNAMFEVFNYLKRENLKTKLLLQIHDELIFESPENEIDKLKKDIPDLMSESHKNLIDLNVPIKVDFGIGNTWDDAH